MEDFMLKAFLQTVGIIFVVGIVYVGVKWSLKKLGLSMQECNQLNADQQATVSTKARIEYLRLKPELRQAAEDDAKDEEDRKEKKKELEKQLKAAKKAA